MGSPYCWELPQVRSGPGATMRFSVLDMKFQSITDAYVFGREWRKQI